MKFVKDRHGIYHNADCIQNIKIDTESRECDDGPCNMDCYICTKNKPIFKIIMKLKSEDCVIVLKKTDNLQEATEFLLNTVMRLEEPEW